ncbi:MAG: hypothetical protein FIB07_08165 [Candidatus Methanoperedens sp.]|nr:hypothetical protein [Candidatus Methanoperedens sp.]
MIVSRSYNNSPQRTQRTQRSVIMAASYGKVKQLRTRMTRIGRIVTDICVSVSSAQSVFYRNSSAFICVHLRLKSVIGGT